MFTEKCVFFWSLVDKVALIVEYFEHLWCLMENPVVKWRTLRHLLEKAAAGVYWRCSTGKCVNLPGN